MRSNKKIIFILYFNLKNVYICTKTIFLNAAQSMVKNRVNFSFINYTSNYRMYFTFHWCSTFLILLFSILFYRLMLLAWYLFKAIANNHYFVTIIFFLSCVMHFFETCRYTRYESFELFLSLII